MRDIEPMDHLPTANPEALTSRDHYLAIVDLPCAEP